MTKKKRAGAARKKTKRTSKQASTSTASSSAKSEGGNKAVKRLYRSKRDRLLGGVAGGMGEYFNIDPTLMRLLWVLLAFISFGGAILLYIIAWIIVPTKK